MSYTGGQEYCAPRKVETITGAAFFKCTRGCAFYYFSAAVRSISKNWNSLVSPCAVYWRGRSLWPTPRLDIIRRIPYQNLTRIAWTTAARFKIHVPKTGNVDKVPEFPLLVNEPSFKLLINKRLTVSLKPKQSSLGFAKDFYKGWGVVLAHWYTAMHVSPWMPLCSYCMVCVSKLSAGADAHNREVVKITPSQRLRCL